MSPRKRGKAGEAEPAQENAAEDAPAPRRSSRQAATNKRAATDAAASGDPEAPPPAKRTKGRGRVQAMRDTKGEPQQEQKATHALAEEETAAAAAPKKGKRVKAGAPAAAVPEEGLQDGKAVQGPAKRGKAAAKKAADTEEPDTDANTAVAPAANNAVAPAPLVPATVVPAAAPSKPAAIPQQGKPAAAAAATAKPAVAAGAGTIKQRPVDKLCPKSSFARVVDDFDAMLSQTNIANNNNKYYIVQLLQEGNQYWLWTRWGRVGENGANKLQGPYGFDGGAREFEKKFREKTGNSWADRLNFVAKAGRYELVEIETDPDAAPQLASPVKGKQVAPAAVIKPCTLDAATKELVEFILNEDMFKESMASYDIDVEKMPLGLLTKAQVQRGYDVLEMLRQAIQQRQPHTTLQELSSRFYQVIPHSFGRQRPPVIASLEVVKTKLDMCNMLGDIEIAQDMLAHQQEPQAAAAAAKPHPTDEKYAMLMADLQLLDPTTEEFSIIQQYVKATAVRPATIEHVWKMERQGEGARFAAHDAMENRRLLWHGTNVAVVAAILKSGLRIMPHSGGRVGRGIYLASEHGKSADYVRCGRLRGSNVGVMFLAEAALGVEHHIARDDPSLTQPPPGFDSVVAKGRRHPDPAQYAELEIGGHKVAVPQGAPVGNPQYAQSSFFQDEYLLYRESQQQLRYLITLKFNVGGGYY